MNSPVKRVEIHAGKQKYGTAGGASTCNAGDAYKKHSEIRRQNKDKLKHSSVTGTGEREKHAWPYSMDRCSISTLLTGSIRNTFVVRY